MSASHDASFSASSAAKPSLPNPTTLLAVGAVGVAATAAGVFLGHDSERVGISWLIALTFWIAISLGILLLVQIHHIFDAGWSTIVRRTHEHWLSVFVWLGLLFLPLLALVWIKPGTIWRWTNATSPEIAGDVLYAKKAAFLNPTAFTIGSLLFFGVWILVSSKLRRSSFAQDEDGSIAHTRENRKTAAWGIPATALSLTFAAFYWLMSLEHHWFSTMYGVWFFASAMRLALCTTVLLSFFLVKRGYLAGIFTKAHLLNIGNLLLAFTVFWAYVTFSQYFLIWNANVPEETFWYNIREQGNWKGIGIFLVFGHFLFPFLFLLQHPLKKKFGSMIFISLWVIAIVLLDFFYNILPSLKVHGDHSTPVAFSLTPWDFTALIGVGGVCFWAFFSSYTRTRAIPIRDPRIGESIHLHE